MALDIKQIVLAFSKKQDKCTALWAVQQLQTAQDTHDLVLEIEQGDPIIAQRLSWVIGLLADQDSALLYPNIGQLIKLCCTPGYHPAIYRNGLKAISTLIIPHQYCAELFDHTIHVLMSPKQPIAQRAHAAQIALNIAQLYPELKSELALIVEEMDREPDLKPALISKLNQIKKRLKIVTD